MSIVKKLTFVFCFLLYVNAFSQNERRILKVGDKVPDLVLSSMVNYSRGSVKISDFDDRLLILDFWTTWCVPCVKAFPLLDSLQRKFGDRIQFLPVTWEEKNKIIRFFDKMTKHRDYVLPTAVDTVLYKNFVDASNRWAGQYVWVLRGKIIAFTTGKDALTEQNINAVLDGRTINEKDRYDRGDVLPNDYTRPCLGVHPQAAGAMLFSSNVSTYIKGLEPGPYTNGSSGLRIINLPLSFMYSYAYGFPSSSDILFDISDVDFFDPPIQRKDSSNLFCYEIISTDNDYRQLLERMRYDLVSVFGYTVTKEKQMVDCAVLKWNGDRKMLRRSAARKFERNSFYVKLESQPIERLIESLDYYLKSDKIRFVVSDIVVDSPITIELSADLSDIKAVNEVLGSYGLILVTEKRVKEMFVIRRRQL